MSSVISKDIKYVSVVSDIYINDRESRQEVDNSSLFNVKNPSVDKSYCSVDLMETMWDTMEHTHNVMVQMDWLDKNRLPYNTGIESETTVNDSHDEKIEKLLENLNIMVEKFEKMENTIIENMEINVKRMENKLDNIENKMENLENKIENVICVLSAFEDNQRAFVEKITDMCDKFAENSKSTVDDNDLKSSTGCPSIVIRSERIEDCNALNTAESQSGCGMAKKASTKCDNNSVSQKTSPKDYLGTRCATCFENEVSRRQNGASRRRTGASRRRTGATHRRNGTFNHRNSALCQHRNGVGRDDDSDDDRDEDQDDVREDEGKKVVKNDDKPHLSFGANAFESVLARISGQRDTDGKLVDALIFCVEKLISKRDICSGGAVETVKPRTKGTDRTNATKGSCKVEGCVHNCVKKEMSSVGGDGGGGETNDCDRAKSPSKLRFANRTTENRPDETVAAIAYKPPDYATNKIYSSACPKSTKDKSENKSGGGPKRVTGRCREHVTPKSSDDDGNGRKLFCVNSIINSDSAPMKYHSSRLSDILNRDYTGKTTMPRPQNFDDCCKDLV